MTHVDAAAMYGIPADLVAAYADAGIRAETMVADLQWSGRYGYDRGGPALAAVGASHASVAARSGPDAPYPSGSAGSDTQSAREASG